MGTSTLVSDTNMSEKGIFTSAKKFSRELNIKANVAGAMTFVVIYYILFHFIGDMAKTHLIDWNRCFSSMFQAYLPPLHNFLGAGITQ